MREVLVDGSTASAATLTRALRAALDGSGPAVLPLHANDPRLTDLRASLAPGEPAEPGTAVVVATSGSTGVPKGVVLSAGALRASAGATHDRLAGPGGWLLVLPAQHIAGVQVLVRSIMAGREPVLMSTAAGFRPRAFTEAASDLLAEDGPHYTALVPTQLARLLDGDALRALRGFAGVLVGGAAAPGALLDRARDAGIRVVATYGMTETAGGCVYDGVPLAGVRVRIAAGGLIELAGPMLASGYRLRPQETAAAFAGGWFRTGDLGRLRPDGSLEVLGRADDVINTGGVKVAAAAVERVLAAQPGVAEVCVVGLPDPEWGQRIAAAVVVSTVDGPPDVGALCTAVRGELGAPAVPKEIRFVDRLPRHGPGKVDRAAVAAAF
ncbi:MAG TPA: o-succinylbenzoate--CoA ligase [Actinophytocola sp.]|uniref:o-succinylbenzoate--CoA ligase n=1 Tax=Actinophytocola sp. TaxID=1872138 RepID=UPI002DDCF3C0|nr:o-succinylbenzoate--CoA ligase [Actinophytocola sp.]HEV2783552.1 o-succinylbenzoate--CoA ligase [Actinophytocola sp.]